MNKRELQANVLRGVRLLDEKDPGWWNGGEGISTPVIEGMVGHIDLETLNMSMAGACILGQRRRAGYHLGRLALGLTNEDAFHHGFNAPFFEYGVDRQGSTLSFLTELWAAVIRSRRFPRQRIARDPFCIKANQTWQREVTP